VSGDQEMLFGWQVGSWWTANKLLEIWWLSQLSRLHLSCIWLKLFMVLYQSMNLHTSMLNWLYGDLTVISCLFIYMCSTFSTHSNFQPCAGSVRSN
jgi:hypothetical protein